MNTLGWMWVKVSTLCETQAQKSLPLFSGTGKADHCSFGSRQALR